MLQGPFGTIDRGLAVIEIEGQVESEIVRQDMKWGAQDHPLTHELVYPQRVDFEEIANDWKAINDERVKDGTLSWDGILLEEVFEALAEDDVDSACTELVQVMAVCAQMILNLRNRGTV